MYFADEVRPVAEVRPDSRRVGKKELRMAAELIDRYAGSFDIANYEDTYRDALLGVIEAKRSGAEIHVERRPEDDHAPDLLEALRRSVEEAKGRHEGPRRRNGANGTLDDLTKDELEKRARRAGVRGYSRMRKTELVRALKSAG
jgi:DNA end-binding protein Ku